MPLYFLRRVRTARVFSVGGYSRLAYRHGLRLCTPHALPPPITDQRYATIDALRKTSHFDLFSITIEQELSFFGRQGARGGRTLDHNTRTQYHRLYPGLCCVDRWQTPREHHVSAKTHYAVSFEHRSVRTSSFSLARSSRVVSTAACSASRSP